jgi:hypothetical protein
MLLFSPLAIQCQSASPNDESKKISSQLPAKVVQMLNTQVFWDAGLNNPSGPRLRFSKLGEFTRPDGHFFRYRVYADGVKEGTPYIFAVWRIGSSVEDLQVLSSTAYVNRKGLLLLNNPKPGQEDSETVADGSEFDVGVKVAKGEPVRFVLRDNKTNMIVPGTLVPFPIESIDKGCKLTALLAAPEGNAVLIYGDGFPPNSVVVVQSNSANELKESKHSVDAKGQFRFVDLPYVLGKEAGVLKNSISTKDCSVSVEIPWGKGSYHQL